MATESFTDALRLPATSVQLQPEVAGQILGTITLVAIASILGAGPKETQQRVIAALRCLSPSRAIEPAGGDEDQRLVIEEATENVIDKIERWADTVRTGPKTNT